MSHFDLERSDTICALATAAGPAAIALVRVSGHDAQAVCEHVFRPRRASAARAFVATLGEVLDVSSTPALVVDEALCTWFPEGRSYTGEASFELSLHGGPSRVRAALRSLVAAGCRLAEPGELTLRAVLTGRLNLVEAEAVHDLVAARSDDAARAALRHMSGGLAARLAPTRAVLVSTLAELEARLDFPDEELGGVEGERLENALGNADSDLQALLQSAAFGERLSQGARIVLYGVPNAGKSTLLNALVGEDRALVHETPGTTRDVLEASAVFGGVPAVLVDVAGVREGELDAVEQMGIERARRELASADMVLLVVDAREPDSRPADAPDDALVVFSKADLTDARPGDLVVSAHTRLGLDAMVDTIGHRLTHDAPTSDEVLLTRTRHREEIANASGALRGGRDALLEGQPHEVVASELRRAGKALDRLLGAELDEDVLDEIFSRFCIGK